MDVSAAFGHWVASAQRHFDAANTAADASRQIALTGTLRQLADYCVAADQAFDAWVKLEIKRKIAKDCCGHDE